MSESNNREQLEVSIAVFSLTLVECARGRLGRELEVHPTNLHRGGLFDAPFRDVVNNGGYIFKGYAMRLARLLPAVLAIGLVVGSVPASAATVLWANVNASGKITKGEGASSAERQSKGAYHVIFNGDVSKCNYGISLVTYGIAFTRPSATDKTAVFIGIIDTRGEDFIDTSFYLQVICK